MQSQKSLMCVTTPATSATSCSGGLDERGVRFVICLPTNEPLQRLADESTHRPVEHPESEPRRSWIEQCLADTEGVYVMASDYVKALPESVSRWFPSPPVALGTDGFGRSESRAALRRFFEVDAAHIAVGALSALARRGNLDPTIVQQAIADLGIDPEAPNPVTV